MVDYSRAFLAIKSLLHVVRVRVFYSVMYFLFCLFCFVLCLCLLSFTDFYRYLKALFSLKTVFSQIKINRNKDEINFNLFSSTF
jgi:hypothetical protein